MQQFHIDFLTTKVIVRPSREDNMNSGNSLDLCDIEPEIFHSTSKVSKIIIRKIQYFGVQAQC